MNMNQERAKQNMKAFMGNLEVLTFSIRYFPGEETKWVAQCNEVDGIITCGTGFDMDQMQDYLEDAILTAAGIPKEFADGLLKKVWGAETNVSARSDVDSDSKVKLFPSNYQLNHYAGMGQI